MEPSPGLALSDPESTSSVSDLGRPAPRLVDTVEHSLDSKTRLTLPAHTRASFASGGYLTLWGGRCIAVLTDEGFDDWIEYLQDELESAGYDDPGAHIKYAHAAAVRFRPDIQGRFQLADRLRDAAGIDRDITIVGAGDRLELWDPVRYGAELEEYRRNIEHHTDRFDMRRRRQP